MRIRVTSGNAPTFAKQIDGIPTPSQLREFEKATQAALMSAITAEAIEVSPKRIRNIADDVHNAALREAMQLFQAVDNVINSGQRGVFLKDIAGRHSLPSTGAVEWRPLSPKYRRWKEQQAVGRLGRRASSADQSRAARRVSGFFVLSGRLRSYMQRQGRSIVLSRFGGVTVKVDLTKLKNNKVNTVQREGDRTIEMELGRITLQIFPNISPSLLPMLASRHWTDTQGPGRFERQFFPERTADKLSGGRGPYRPLVLPITQYFMASRIPGAIRHELVRTVGRNAAVNR